jgi:ribonucleotide monophosphatase NagD (HAD superfamily)
VDVPDHRILAIGDGIATDVRGVQGENIDCLFITGGLAARDTKTVTQPDPDALAAYLAAEMQSPLLSIGVLR